MSEETDWSRPIVKLWEGTFDFAIKGRILEVQQICDPLRACIAELEELKLATSENKVEVIVARIRELYESLQGRLVQLEELKRATPEDKLAALSV